MSSNREEQSSSVEIEVASDDVLIGNVEETFEESLEKCQPASSTVILQLAESETESITEAIPSCSKKFLCMECEEKLRKIKSLKRQVRRWRNRCMSLCNKVCI